MLRIIVFDELSVLKVRFEGTLDAGCVLDYRRAISSALAEGRGRQLLADVGDLQLGDYAAEAAILDGLQLGFAYVAAKGRIAALLRKQDDNDCREQCGAVRRLAFVLTKTCASSPRPLCLKLYRLLHRQPY